ncbi:MAG: sulfite exporter TauE/SafE family protein [Burkholderiales bacterium]
MTGALAVTAALMGLAGTAHCASMCAVGCSAAARLCGPVRPRQVRVALLLGRLLGAAAAGAAAASAAYVLRWAVDGAQWLRPLWTMLQLALVVLGVSLLLRGRVPARLIDWAHHLGRRRDTGVQRIRLPGEVKAFSLGMLWAALPCGLLHAALLVAALASTPLEGALVMVVFGLASTPGLVAGAALWARIPAWAGRGGDAGATLSLRLAGAGIAGMAAWSVGHALWDPWIAAWCG